MVYNYPTQAIYTPFSCQPIKIATIYISINESNYQEKEPFDSFIM